MEIRAKFSMVNLSEVLNKVIRVVRTVQSRFSTNRTFLTFALMLWTIAVPAWWIQAGYQDVAVTEKLSFDVSDGWCNPAVQGIGRHCFGDFQSPQTAVNSQQKPEYADEFMIYPPPAFMPFVLVGWISDVLNLGARGALWLYLGLSASALSLPALIVLCNRSVRNRLLLGFLIGPICLPMLQVLDRGNNLAFAVPFVLIYGLLARNQRYVGASIAVAFAVSIKPQLVLLFLLLLGLRQFRAIVTGVLATGALLLSGFLAWPGTPTDNIRGWLRSLNSYQSYQSVSTEYPANLSASRATFQLSQITGTEFIHHPAIGIAVLLLVVVTCLLRGQRMQFTSLFFVAALTSILIPDLSYHYYLAVLLAPTAVLLTAVNHDQSLRSWLSNQALALLAALTLVPLPIAIGKSSMSVSPHFSGLLCLSVLIVLLFAAWAPESRTIFGRKIRSSVNLVEPH